MNKNNVIDMYVKNIPIKKIAEFNGINRRTVHNIIKNSEVSTRTTNLKKSDRLQVIKMFVEGEKATDIAKLYNINTHTVYNILKENNIQYRHGTRKYFPDEEVFKSINNSSCYWAGFIAADGNISQNNISIGLKKSDYEHLQKFLRFINADYPIFNKKDGTVNISVGSKKMVKDLKRNFNIFHKKTFTITLPDLPDKLMFHYIRGFFDGDGSIYLRKNCIYFDITSGSKQQIYGIQSVMDRAGIKCYIYDYNNKYSIRKSGKDAISLFNILYKDSTKEILLNRKKERFDKYVSVIKNNHKNKKYNMIFTKRNIDIYKMKREGTPVTLISKYFNISQSNCYFIIKKINDFFKEHNETF